MPPAPRPTLTPRERYALRLWLRSFLPYQRRWIAEPATLAICCKPRQAGQSHATAGGAVYNALLTGSTEVIISASQDLSDEVLAKAKAHARVLQRFGLPAATEAIAEDSARVLAWGTGGRVVALPANPRTARSYTGNVWLDEYAYHVDAEGIWDAAAAVAIRGNRRVRIVSTPNGAGGRFYDSVTHPPAGWALHKFTIHDAIREGCNVSLAKCWQLAGGNKRTFAQWFECSFLHAGDCFFDDETLDAGDAAVRAPLPLEQLGEPFAALARTYGASALRVWARPVAGAGYVVGGDPSGGGAGGDYAAATVRRRGTREHVATLRLKLKPNPFGVALLDLGRVFNFATVATERNNHGAATAAVLEAVAYAGAWCADDGKTGFLTNAKTRPALLGDYERGVREGAYPTPDGQLAAERRTFVIGEDGQPRAAAGCHDDLVLADAICCRVLDQPLPHVGAVDIAGALNDR